MNAQGKTIRYVVVCCVLGVCLQGSLGHAASLGHILYLGENASPAPPALGQTLYLSEAAVPPKPNLGLQPADGNSPEEATFVPVIALIADHGNSPEEATFVPITGLIAGHGDTPEEATFVPTTGLIADHGDTPEEATYLPTAGRSAGAVQFEGDVDWFRIEVPVDGVLSVGLLSNTAIEVSIQDQNHQEVAWAACSGSMNGLAIAQHLTAGTCYVRVAALQYVPGNAYDITTNFKEN